MGVGSEVAGEIAQELVIEHLPRKQGISAMGIGAMIGAAIGMFCGNYYVRNKLIPFDNEVAQETKADLKSRPLAGLVNNNNTSPESATPEGAFDRANSFKRINSKDYPFARFVYNAGGKGIFGLIGGAVGAIVGGAIGYALKGKQPPESEPVITTRPARRQREETVVVGNPIPHEAMTHEQWRSGRKRQSGICTNPYYPCSVSNASSLPAVSSA